MGKKNKAKQSTSPMAGAPSGGQAAYWREKLPRLVAQGREPEALGALERFWPARDAARARVLVGAWPDRLVAELPHPLPEDVAAELGPAALAFDDGPFGAMVAGAGELAPELRALRQAAGLLEDGRVPEAREALQSVGLRSPVRAGRAFVRALCAVQEGGDDEARRALDTLAGSPFEGAAARVRAALDGGDPASAQRLGLASAPSGVGEVVRHLMERRPNEALVAAARCAPALSPGLLRLLRRDLPAALLARGVPPDAIPGRVEKALRADPEDPGWVRLRAVIGDIGGCPCCASERWDALLDAVRKGRAARSLDRPKVEAALHTRAAETLLQRGSFDDLMGLDELDALDADELLDRIDAMEDSGELEGRRRAAGDRAATERLHAALALDAGRRGAWDALLRVLERQGDAKALADYAEDLARAFPADPDALLVAARLCSDRGAFTRASEHARRAAALAPDEQRVRDLEAEILMGRARKQVPRRVAEGRKLALAASHVYGTTPAVRLRARALAGAFELSSGTEAGYDALRDQERAAGTTPWEWHAHLVVAGYEAKLRLTDRAHATAAGEDDWGSWPPPGPAALRSVLQLADRFARERLPMPVVLQRMARRLAPLATCLTDLDDLILALRFCEAAESALPLAEHATAVHPRDPAFWDIRIHLAMELQRPPAELAGAEEALAEMIAQRRGAWGADDDDPFSHAPHPALASLQRLLETLRSYVADWRPAPPPSPGGGKGARNKKKVR